MFRSFAAAAVLVISSMAAMGCSSGLSPDDAAIRCDQEKAAKGQLFGKDTYAACLSCFEECGDACAAIPSSPPTYTCADSSTTSTSAASGSTGQ